MEKNDIINLAVRPVESNEVRVIVKGHAKSGRTTILNIIALALRLKFHQNVETFDTDEPFDPRKRNDAMAQAISEESFKESSRKVNIFAIEVPAVQHNICDAIEKVLIAAREQMVQMDQPDEATALLAACDQLEDFAVNYLGDE